MKLARYIPLLLGVLVVGYFVANKKGDPCRVYWRVGTVDPQFNISDYDVNNAATSAASMWNDAVGKRVLWYSKERGIPMNLVFGAGHGAMATEIATTQEIRRLGAEIDNLKEQFKRTQTQYMVDHINEKIERYNKLVTAYNNSPPVEIKQGSYQEKLEIYAFADLTDLKIVMAHEFGHALGIGHIETPGAVMNAKHLIGTTIQGLQDADVAALKRVCSI